MPLPYGTMDDDSPNLSFATLPELLGEIAERCDAMVFAGLLKAESGDEGDTMTFLYGGSVWTAIGLVRHAGKKLESAFEDEPDDDE